MHKSPARIPGCKRIIFNVRIVHGPSMEWASSLCSRVHSSRRVSLVSFAWRNAIRGSARNGPSSTRWILPSPRSRNSLSNSSSDSYPARRASFSEISGGGDLRDGCNVELSDGGQQTSTGFYRRTLPSAEGYGDFSTANTIE
jgi:hypothetical protein